MVSVPVMTNAPTAPSASVESNSGRLHSPAHTPASGRRTSQSRSSGARPRTSRGVIFGDFGLSWQVIPTAMGQLLWNPDLPGTQAAFRAMLGMRKLDVAVLRKAFDGLGS